MDGMQHLLDLIERTVIRSSIWHFIRGLPTPVVVVVFALAALAFLASRRRRSQRRRPLRGVNPHAGKCPSCGRPVVIVAEKATTP